MSPSEIAKGFLKLEEKNNLFEWESEGVFIWQLCRINIFNFLLSRIKAGAQSHKKNILIRLLNKRYRFKNIFIHNPFKDTKRSDVLIFESSRYVKVDGKFVDPYTHFFADELRQKYSLTRYQSNYVTDHLSEKGREVKHLDFIEYNCLKKAKKKSFNLNENDKIKIKLIEGYFESEYKINLNLSSLISYWVSYYLCELGYFRKLLDIKKPTSIFLVDYNSKMSIITAAKERKIETTELQHGVMVGEDIIYHYPSVKEGTHRYFPDKFIVWNEIWKNSCKLPISLENVSIRKNDLIEIKKKKYSEIKKNKKQILIASQYDLTNEIASEVLANIDNLKDFQIVYKLHPVEYASLDSNENLKKLRKIKNINFPDSKADLHKLLAESEYFIGVYTFVIFEALEFGCKINLLELPGIEMMNFLKTNSQITFLKKLNEFKI